MTCDKGHRDTGPLGHTPNKGVYIVYKIPEVGTFLPAKKNTTVKNPGPVHNPTGNTEFLQADAQDKAYQKNLVLIEEWKNVDSDSPAYAAQLGAKSSFAVLVIEAEAGGVTFDIQPIGPAVQNLNYPTAEPKT